MNLKEFVRLDPKQIRGDEGLMQLFVNFYEAAFSFKPKCAGCSFKTGFKKLKEYANGKTSKNNITIMATKTFQLKKEFRLKILSYKKNGKTLRCYGYNLTEEFAKGLLDAGQEHIFIKNPSKVEEIEVVDAEAVSKSFQDMNYKEELIPLYNDLKEKTGKKAKSYKKDDIIHFLENEG